MLILAIIVTIIFYYILKSYNTANILPSTLSVTTSFIAVYLTARRSPYFALAYALNDIVLIYLWILASTVALTILIKICKALNCQIEDIVEVKDETLV